jgi:hypothetical protein
VTSALVTRSAAAALYWARLPRRDDDAIIGSLAGLSDDERLAVRGVLQARTLSPLSDDELVKLMLELGAKKVVGIEHKTVLDVTTETGTETGVFSGYLAVFSRDASGDSISPAGLDQTVADFQAGRRPWLLTDTHSHSATDVVAEVTSARVDSVGLFITAKWLSSDRAQQLRQMVLDGARLGLSIDYTAESRPDGRGGRQLTQVTVYGGAITNRPMNGLAMITEGKAGASASSYDGMSPEQALAIAEVAAYGERQAAAALTPSLNADGHRAMAGILDRIEGDSQMASLMAWANSPEVAAEYRRDPNAVLAERDRDAAAKANAYSNDLASFQAQQATMTGCAGCQWCARGVPSSCVYR